MKIKPKEALLNLPIVLLFNNRDEIPSLASNANTFIHGKVKIKYEELGVLNGQYVGIFYLQRNDEYHDIRGKFMDLIDQSEMFMKDVTGETWSEFEERLDQEYPPEDSE